MLDIFELLVQNTSDVNWKVSLLKKIEKLKDNFK